MKIGLDESRAIDALKGLLLIAVIFGHLFTSRVLDDPIKYFLYGFHMPAFLFLSGYLTSNTKLESQTFLDVYKSRLVRLVLPWLAATLVFLSVYEPSAFIGGLPHFLKKSFSAILSPLVHSVGTDCTWINLGVA